MRAETVGRPRREGVALLGTRRDWRLCRPGRVLRPTPGLHWVGPLAVVATSLWFWPAFAGTRGEDGDVSFGLYIGAVSIALMAWSFVLAVRIRIAEPFFGGLDRMYRIHRWAGALSVPAMYLHTSQVDELLAGVPGAGKDLADTAQDLAGLAQNALYVLIALSVLRMMPYRWWRWTHKLFGIPFLVASFHFFTADKPYANTSSWGWYFNVVMVVGALAWIWRLIGRDVFGRGARYRVAAVNPSGSTVDIRLVPMGRPLRHRVGQFAFVRIDRSGAAEPHPFSIASPPGADELRFAIRSLGDWSSRLPATIRVGDEVRVEGPYGRFRPLPSQPCVTVWVAGGVGITPFLSALDAASVVGIVPYLLYAVRTADDAVAIDQLRALDAAGTIRLRLFESTQGVRLGPDALDELDDLAAAGLHGAHVALCGPSGLVRTMAAAARERGARHVEHEEFDIRSGLGPDLSEEVTTAVEQLRARRTAAAR